MFELQKGYQAIEELFEILVNLCFYIYLHLCVGLERVPETDQLENAVEGRSAVEVI